jgi:Tripartite tricarboxylate transporter TctB family
MNVLVKSDFWLGGIVFLGGFWAYFQCRGFDEHSSGYPSFLALVHIVLGFCLILKAMKEMSDMSDSLKRLFQEIRGPIIVAVMLMGWGVLLMLGLGYLLSSCIMLPMVLYALGYKGIKRLAFTTASIVTAVFVLFYLLFEVPLPLHPVVEQLFS